MFRKLLVANRGEIAVRIIRACQEMNIRTVAVYSEADAESLHVRIADEAVCIGPADPAKSYLHIPSIISAAEIADVEAIHPGYGFLAENAHFAEVCTDCRITFVGPSPETMRQMGDKINAKEAMRKAGVPIIPGSRGCVDDPKAALKLAKDIHYPIIIKATSGGGGKGMRVCHNDVRLNSALTTARTEAERSFGRGDVYIERYFEQPRHIEVQVLADQKHHVVHLGERDCSIQRRHQKLLEEAPAPGLDAKMRRKLGEAAVKAAKASHYTGAGTVEFLLSESGEFFFMEMNTRIQVEHPVTEAITGIDLIKAQIRVAAGEPLPWKQDDITFQGAAIECRINAEDPARDFIPMPGRIEFVHWPGGPGVRVDTCVYSGYMIPSHYDSMIGKLIVHGQDRATAAVTMRRALDEFILDPLATTADLHRRIVRHPDFLKGGVTTKFVERLLRADDHK